MAQAAWVPMKGLGLVLELPMGDTASLLRTVAAAVATPYIAYRLRPLTSFMASAQTIEKKPTSYAQHLRDRTLYQEYPDLKSIVSTFYPTNLLMIIGKNIGLQFLMKFNFYMLEVMEHERLMIEIDEHGGRAPEMPCLPDFSPVIQSGFYGSLRELFVTCVRRVYEHITVYRLANKSKAMLRDSRLWIRDVLQIKHRQSPLLKKFVAYQFAALHSSALFYAADCTVSVAYHTFRTYHRPDKSKSQKAVLLLKGSALQLARCLVTLLAVSIGSSAGSLIMPGLGTSVGHLLTDMAVTIGCSALITSILEP